MINEVKKMIIPIEGNVTYPITLDASVWIFDERKIIFEDAFTNSKKPKKEKEENYIKEAAERLNRAYDPRVKRNINRNLNKQEQEDALTYSYVMPIKPFLEHTEPKENAKIAHIITINNVVEIPLTQLENSVLLFSKEGKPITDKGPVHLYFKDGSNKDNPIKGINKFKIK